MDGFFIPFLGMENRKRLRRFWGMEVRVSENRLRNFRLALTEIFKYHLFMAIEGRTSLTLPERLAREESEAAARFEGNPTFTQSFGDIASIYALRLEIPIDVLDKRRCVGDYPDSMKRELFVNLLRGAFNSTLGRIFKKAI